MSQLIKKIRTDAGDLQIDYNALANLPDLTPKFSNPNLLINSDFRNPINQRGQSEYSFAQDWKYSIDRWKFIGDLDVKPEAGYLSLTNGENVSWFQQKFEKSLPADNYTLTVKVLSVVGECDMKFENSSGVQLEKTIDKTGLVTASFNGPVNAITFELNGTDGHLSIEWVKLEQGTMSTPFVPRIYAEEVALCRRFYQVETFYNSDVVCYLHKRGQTSYGGIKHFEPMRIIPTVTKSGNFYIERYNSGGLYPTTEDQISSIEMTPQWSELKFIIELSTSDPVNYLAVASDSVVLRFDAEIY